MALDCGVPADKYWDFTLQELVDIIESQTRRKKEEISQFFMLANAISTRISYFFSDPKKRRESDILQPWDVYPALFEQVKEEREEAKVDAELEAYKARMAMGIDRWNSRFKEENEDEQ